MRRRLPPRVHDAAAVIVMMEELPLTSNGKVDRKRCRRRQERMDAGVEEGSRLEEIVSGIFAQVLGIDRTGGRRLLRAGGDSCGYEADTFERETLKVEMPLHGSLPSSTVKGLALRVEEAIGGGRLRERKKERRGREDRPAGVDTVSSVGRTGW